MEETRSFTLNLIEEQLDYQENILAGKTGKFGWIHNFPRRNELLVNSLIFSFTKGEILRKLNQEDELATQFNCLESPKGNAYMLRSALGITNTNDLYGNPVLTRIDVEETKYGMKTNVGIFSTREKILKRYLEQKDRPEAIISEIDKTYAFLQFCILDWHSPEHVKVAAGVGRNVKLTKDFNFIDKYQFAYAITPFIERKK